MFKFLAFLGTIKFIENICQLMRKPLTFMCMLSIFKRNLCIRSAHASVTNTCTEHTSKELIPALSIRYLSEHKHKDLKGTQDWDFFWLWFWNLDYFFVSHVKILRFYKKNFRIGPFWGEVRFFRVVLGLRRMKKNFELGQKIFLFIFYLWTLFMSQY